jgi:hypothetical protein
MVHAIFFLSAVAALGLGKPLEGTTDQPFYVAENPQYTIVDSTMDSLRFTLTKTLRRNTQGHVESMSSFVSLLRSGS